jgi:hypothetical protein
LRLVSYLSKIPIHHTCSLDFKRWIPQIDGSEPANVATLSLVGAAACLHYYEPSLRPWAPARFSAAGSRSQRLISRALVIVHFPLLTGRSPPAPKHPPPSLPLSLWALCLCVFCFASTLVCSLFAFSAVLPFLVWREGILAFGLRFALLLGSRIWKSL